MFTKLDHITIVVHDLAAAKTFFTDLGFTIRREGELKGEWIDHLTGLEDVDAYYVGLILPQDTMNLELISFNNPKGDRDEKISQLNQVGFRHLAFEVKDIEGEVEKLKSKGVAFLSEVQTYGAANKKLCYFIGPEGIVLEMAEYGSES